MDALLNLFIKAGLCQDLVTRRAKSRSDYEAAERVATVVRECIEYAKGDSAVFTNELQRRTVDTAIPRR